VIPKCLGEVPVSQESPEARWGDQTHKVLPRMPSTFESAAAISCSFKYFHLGHSKVLPGVKTIPLSSECLPRFSLSSELSKPSKWLQGSLGVMDPGSGYWPRVPDLQEWAGWAWGSEPRPHGSSHQSGRSLPQGGALLSASPPPSFSYFRHFLPCGLLPWPGLQWAAVSAAAILCVCVSCLVCVYCLIPGSLF
jgi:hypothetical protein